MLRAILQLGSPRRAPRAETLVLAAIALIHAVGIGWGLPASDAWDNDGVAPRDFLPGILATFTPGAYFQYPPVHLLLLTVLTLPITGIALASAPGLDRASVVSTMLGVRTMTALSLVARGVALLMSVGICWAMAGIAELAIPPDDAPLRARVRALTTLTCGLGLSLTYYGHTSNLDVPYLFWASLALLALARAMAEQEPERLVGAAVLGALAIGTKDQAYALFVLAAPLGIGAWLACDAWARAHALAIAKAAGKGIALLVALVIVEDGALVNPTGFAARLHFLSGSASQDFAQYSSDAAGRLAVLEDTIRHWTLGYPAALAPLGLVGLGVAFAATRGRGRARAAVLIPALAAVSFTVAFNLVARRTEHRFVMPQLVMASVYLGLGTAWLAFAPRRRAVRIAAQAALAILVACEAFDALDVDANLVLDPRYDAERWLAANTREGDTVEVHGLNVYLPRFPAGLRVTRVGPGPITGRNPMPGFVEVQAPYDRLGERAPRFVVVSQATAAQFLNDPRGSAEHGRVFPASQVQTGLDPDGTGLFRGLFEGTRGYRLVHVSAWRSTLWPRLDIHASVAREIWIYERRPS